MTENTVHVPDNHTKRSVRCNYYHLREKPKGNLHVVFDVLVLVARTSLKMEGKQIQEPFGICHLIERPVTTCHDQKFEFPSLAAIQKS